jgi:sarcosine oxidase, subunit gamma
MAEAMQRCCLVLGETDAQREQGIATDALVIRLLPPRARFSLRIDASVLSNTKEVAGFTLDMPINRRTLSGERVAMRLGPDEWLLTAGQGETAAIARGVEATFRGLRHGLVDVGHRYIALCVAGARAADAINSGCPLDLSSAAFPPGSAARTLLAKAEVILSRNDERPAYAIECARSFGAYVAEFLRNAARQYRT